MRVIVLVLAALSQVALAVVFVGSPLAVVLGFGGGVAAFASFVIWDRDYR